MPVSKYDPKVAAINLIHRDLLLPWAFHHLFVTCPGDQAC